MKKAATHGVKKQFLYILFILLLLGLTVYALAKSNTELSFSNIINFIKSSNPAYIAAAFLCMLLFIFFEGLSIHVICARLGYKRPLYSSMVYSTADIYYSAITPGASGGQPASAFYMIKDDVDGGTTSFALVLNLAAYIGAILVVAVVAFALDSSIFLRASFWSKLLIVIGIIIQTALLVFFILCMRCHNLVLKAGNGGIRLLTKIKIIKKPDKWIARYTAVVEKYKLGYEHIKQHKSLFLQALALNVIQRFSQILIPCFVCYSVSGEVPFYQLVAMQSFVLLGYNSIPLPGGTGAYEYLYLDIYGLAFTDAFVSSSLMVSRAISYYINMIVCGLITLTYHIFVTNRKSARHAEVEKTEAPADENIT